jgi:hypothetical protein
MSDPTPGQTIVDHETRELIKHFKRRKWLYLVVILGFGSYSFYLFKFHLLYYTSTASFLINDHSIISPSTLEFKSLESISSQDNFNRTYELINSAATQKHLIEKFGLMKHYGIDSTQEFAMQKTTERIRSNITVKKSPFNTISVTVRDKYRYLAADMANEIVSYLENLNEESYIKNLQKKIDVSQAYLKQLQKDNNEKSAEIERLLRHLDSLLARKNITGKLSEELMTQQQKLNQVMSTFQFATYELISSQKLYNLSQQSLNFKSFPTITILLTAMPAARSTAVTAALLSLGIMVLTFMILILQAYLFIHYKDYIRLILFDK